MAPEQVAAAVGARAQGEAQRRAAGAAFGGALKMSGANICLLRPGEGGADKSEAVLEKVAELCPFEAAPDKYTCPVANIEIPELQPRPDPSAKKKKKKKDDTSRKK